jgi:hypothetical protein
MKKAAGQGCHRSLLLILRFTPTPPSPCMNAASLARFEAGGGSGNGEGGRKAPALSENQHPLPAVVRRLRNQNRAGRGQAVGFEAG